MEGATHIPVSIRQSNLRKSFKLAIRALLTACSKEEFNRIFSTFNHTEQEGLHQLFIQVIASLHDNIAEEFESICHETQACNILDMVEQCVEQQSLDVLSAEKMNLGEIKEEVSRAKRNEIQHLTSMLEKVEEQNRLMRARIESLKTNQNLLTTPNAIEKFQSCNLNYARLS